jgi:hypothetical protein
VSVAIVQDRPFLGGNASIEIGLRPRGVIGPVVEETYQRKPGGDLHTKGLLDKDPYATVFVGCTVFAATTNDSRVVSIDARNARSGREIRLPAPIFIDCSGRALFGRYSGADTLFDEESRDEYGEPLAPTTRTKTHHGNTVFSRASMADSPVSFPPMPWATEVAKDFANLGGQLIKPGIENGKGPSVSYQPQTHSQPVRRRMILPLTFWEYGQHLDPYTHGEHIRDHLLRAIYGTFSNVKELELAKLIFNSTGWPTLPRKENSSATRAITS